MTTETAAPETPTNGNGDTSENDGAATFDDLLEYHNNAPGIRTDSSEETETEEGAETDADGNAAASDSEGETEVQASDESGTSETAGDAESKGKPGKEIILKIGDQEIKATDDTIIVLPVNGELKEFKLGEIKTDINGREFYAKKLSEADAKAKRAEAEILRIKPWAEEMTRIDTHMKEINACVEKGDGFGAWVEIMRMQGKDLRQELPQFLKQVNTARERWEKMSPEQRQALLAKEDAERSKRENEKETNKTSEELQKTKFENYVLTKQTETGLDRKTLDWYFDQLASQGYWKQDKFKGLAPEQYVDETIRFIEIDNRFKAVESAIKSVAPTEESDEYVNKIAAVVDFAQRQEKVVFTKTDIEEIVRKDLTRQGKSTVKGEKKTASAKTTATAKPAASNGTPEKGKPKTETSTPQTWNDFD